MERKIILGNLKCAPIRCGPSFIFNNETTFFTRAYYRPSRVVTPFRPIEYYFVSANLLKFDCKIVEVSCSLMSSPTSSEDFTIMSKAGVINNAGFDFFSIPEKFICSSPRSLFIQVKTIRNSENYQHEFMDTTWMTQLWLTVTNRQFTDVVISVGKKKNRSSSSDPLDSQSCIQHLTIKV